VADALLPHPEIELVMYMEGDRVLVRSSAGTAATECRGGKLRYVAVDHDVLRYQPVIDALNGQGKLPDGFASDDDWFAATLDHEYPDAPRRIWDAFHGMAVNPPRVMFTTHDGWCAGLPEFEKFIKMASTHGSLNQINSATFVMSMTRGRLTGPMRSREVLGHVQPGFEPRVRVK
jgi:hypothetical protein